jgi:hypothetical protein
MLVEIVALVIFAVVVAHTVRTVERWAQRYIDKRLGTIVVAIDTRFNDEFPKFCAGVKAELHQTIENVLAKELKKPDNIGAPDPAAPPEPEAPFWKNRQKLEAAQAAINRGEIDLDAELGALSPVEAARDIDAALLEISQSDPAT